MSELRFHYAADVVRVVDGDTLHVVLDLGLEVRLTTSLRLYGINAPEMRTPEGPPARFWLVAALPVKIGGGLPTVFVRTHKDRREKYGRYLAELWVDEAAWEEGEPSINARMVSAGHAAVYLP